jgi:DNA-binding CsgD family transcriptional regulator
MNKPLQLIFSNYSSLIFIFAVLFACCGPETPKNSSTDAPPEMERLLLAADTLSTGALTAEARKLPGTWADTFFQKRCYGFIQTPNPRALFAAASNYERIRPDDEAAGAFIHFSRGVAQNNSGKLDSSEFHFKQAQDYYEKKGSKKYLYNVLDCRSGTSTMRGRFDEAILLKYKALEIQENEADRMYIKVSIANTFIHKGDTTSPFELLLEPVRFFEETRDTINWAFALTIQGNAYARKNNYTKCLELNQKAFLLRRAIGQKGTMLENINNMARSHGKLGNWQAALDTLSTAEKLMAATGLRNGQTFIQLATGEALFHLNRLSEADVVLLQNLEICRARKQYALAAPAADLLSKSKKMQGKIAESLEFREQNVAMKDTLYSKEKEKIIQDAASKYETREKAAEIVALKLEKQLSDQRNLLGGGFLLSVVGAGAWFLRYRHRREKDLLEKDIATKRLENEVLLATENLNRTTLENNARELDIHKAQLEEFTALMLEKNAKIEALQSFKGESSSDVESNSAMQNALNDDDVDALFQSALLNETDWQRFQKHFEKVFPGILNRLKIEYQELSIAELRLVLLTKMGLKTNEIAVFIGISSESVRKLRYRFKKKMGISEEEMLDSVEDK